MIELLRSSDDAISKIVKGISDLIVNPGIINLDIDDIKYVLGESGIAKVGIGSSTGTDRASKAALRAITSPLTEGEALNSSRAMLLSIASGPNITIDEISEIAGLIQESANESAHIFFGTTVDESLGEEIRVTLIAAGIEAEK